MLVDRSCRVLIIKNSDISDTSWYTILRNPACTRVVPACRLRTTCWPQFKVQPREPILLGSSWRLGHSSPPWRSASSAMNMSHTTYEEKLEKPQNRHCEAWPVFTGVVESLLIEGCDPSNVCSLADSWSQSDGCCSIDVNTVNSVRS